MKESKKYISKSDLKRLDAMTDGDIDYSDIPATDEIFWKNAKVIMPKHKRQITLRIDDDIIDWFQHEGKGYQTKINAVLRMFVDAQKKK
jgi:uncharacterized protein (DUF4415 family)